MVNANEGVLDFSVRKVVRVTGPNGGTFEFSPRRIPYGTGAQFQAKLEAINEALEAKKITGEQYCLDALVLVCEDFDRSAVEAAGFEVGELNQIMGEINRLKGIRTEEEKKTPSESSTT